MSPSNDNIWTHESESDSLFIGGLCFFIVASVLILVMGVMY